MNTEWAAQNLQTIRTLMERSALYRRAMAPITLTIGTIGFVSAIAAIQMEGISANHFILWWLATAAIAMTSALFLMKRQASQEGETFWSAPARKVAQAMAPAFVGAGLLTLGLLLPSSAPAAMETDLKVSLIPPLLILFYGCGVHAAGFFIPRGVKLFGWIFILSGIVLWVCPVQTWLGAHTANAEMGLFFGLFHQIYGVYLYITERKEPTSES